MNMESSTSSQLPTCQNTQLTHYDCQSRMKNGHEIISMITVTNIPEHRTHLLWFSEQHEWWAWNLQHDHSHQHAKKQNSHSMIARTAWTMVNKSSAWSQPPTCHNIQLTIYMIARAWGMDMEWSAWSQSPTCQNTELTLYDFQSRMKNKCGIIGMIQSSTCQNAQLTVYNFQDRIKNGHGIINMIIVNMLECTTYPLWFPEQDEEWTWNHQHDHSHQHVRMHNSPTMIARARCGMYMKSLAWTQSPTCQNAQPTLYDSKSRTKNGHGMISMITNVPECTTNPLWLPDQDEK